MQSLLHPLTATRGLKQLATCVRQSGQSLLPCIHQHTSATALSSCSSPLDVQASLPVASSRLRSQVQARALAVAQPQQSSTSTSGSIPCSMTLHVESALGPLSTNPLVPPAKPVVIIISGPSGVGKDAVLNRLKQLRPDLYFVVTATSRGMRPGEVEGKDYFFVTKQKFEEWKEHNMLLEHALVYGEYKGIPRQQVDSALAAGTDVVLRIDVQGAATVRKLLPDVISIFITAESEDALVRRLVARKTEDQERMVIRAQTARQENAHIPAFDYVVVNRDGQLDDCALRISHIIDSEKCRVARMGM